MASRDPLQAHADRIARDARRIRLAMGLSTSRVARRLGLRSKSNIIEVELGVRRLTVPWLRKLADGLDVTPGQLFRGEVRYERLHIVPAPPAEPVEAPAEPSAQHQPLWPKKAGWP